MDTMGRSLHGRLQRIEEARDVIERYKGDRCKAKQTRPRIWNLKRRNQNKWVSKRTLRQWLAARRIIVWGFLDYKLKILEDRRVVMQKKESLMISLLLYNLILWSSGWVLQILTWVNLMGWNFMIGYAVSGSSCSL